MDPTALAAIISTGTPSAIFAAVFIYILNKYISATEKREEWFRQAVKDLTGEIGKVAERLDKVVERLDKLESRQSENERRRP